MSILPLLGAALLLAAHPAGALPPTVNPAFGLPEAESAPQAVRSSTLIENPAPWNGKAVLFTGEAIGEVMVRGEMAWIHCNDDVYMWKNLEEGAPLGGFNSGQAIWLPAAEARKIAFFGDYKHEGDVVTARGVFNSACNEHGGDMDIHAAELTIVKPGHPVPHLPNRQRAMIALALLFVSLLLWFARRRAALRRI
jgi:hypothetical protein